MPANLGSTLSFKRPASSRMLTCATTHGPERSPCMCTTTTTYFRESMATGTGEVVGVVSRRDFDGTGTHLHVHQLCVRNDGQQAAIDGVDCVFPNHVGVPGIIRVDDDGGITQHGFQACGCHLPLTSDVCTETNKGVTAHAGAQVRGQKPTVISPPPSIGYEKWWITPKRVGFSSPGGVHTASHTSL